jgi:ribosomal protein S18 acetylase RimI-like enzyme
VLATIRPATVDDVEAIAEVHVASWRWAYAGQIDDTYLASLSARTRADQWRGWFQERDERSLLLVADDGHVVGFIEAGRADGRDRACGEIHALYLLGEAAGTGLGRKLLDAATVHLSDAGFERSVLWLLATNERALRFYERAGWSLDGLEDTYEIGGRPMPIVRMGRAL